MRLVAISVFPVKGSHGISVEEAELQPRGLRHDRRWMLVDPRGRFVTQREMPALARLQAEPTPFGLRLAFDGETAEIGFPPEDAPRLPVSVWESELLLPEAEAAAPWLHRSFGQALRLVFQPEDAHRPVAGWAEDHEVSLADGFPLLLATTASLDAFQREAGAEIGPGLGMERFRPNLVIAGASPWEEDCWEQLRIGAVEVKLAAPCPRCTVTTVDQDRGIVTGDEPLETLRRIRMSGERSVPGLLFGWHAVPRRLGIVRLGDPVEVLSTRPRWAIRPAASPSSRRQSSASPG